MKKFSKILSVALLVALVLSLGVTNAFATGEGSLTVKNSESGTTYKFYKIFDLTGTDISSPADGTYDAVAYTIDTEWVSFFNNAGASYLSATQTGSLNPINVGGVTKYINIIESNRVDFTNAAMKYAIDNDLEADATASGDTGADVDVEGLDLGYYLMVPVDATDEKTNPLTTGSIASLTSTIPDGEIYVKATKPGVVKTDDVVTADIGQTVNYTLTGQVPNTSGTASFIYKLSDTMSEGLTFNNDVSVTIGGTAVAPATVATWIEYANNGFVITIPVVDYQANKGQDIVLSYSAVVNEKAIQTTNEKNSAQVIYGRDPDHLERSTPVEEELYSANIIINKFTGDSSTGKKLADATFALMKFDDQGNTLYYKYTEVAGDDPDVVSWVAVANANFTKADVEAGTATVSDAVVNALKTAGTGTDSTITIKTTDANGAAAFNGLKDGTYYLIEIEAPQGYNRLSDPTTVTVTGTNVDDATHLENQAYAGQTEFDEAVDQTADVQNNTGSVLPSTGGIGTTIFYVVGGVLVLAAIILLVTKKRMSE